MNCLISNISNFHQELKGGHKKDQVGLAIYLNPVNQNPAKIRNFYKDFVKNFHFKGILFPVHKKHYAKTEKQNNIFISVFGSEDKTPYHIYTSKQTFGKDDDFLLLSSSKNPHCVLIKDFDRFITNKTNHHGKNLFCRYYLQCFSSSKVLECRTKNCLAINHKKSVLTSEEDPHINFKNLKDLQKHHS